MRIPLLLFAACGVLTIGLAGCAQKRAAKRDTDPLDRTFGTSVPAAATPTPNSGLPTMPADVTRQVATVRQDVVRRDYGKAAVRLEQLQRAPNLSGDQLRALHDEMAVVQQRLAEKAASGDPEAKRAWKNFQDSMTK